MSESTAATRASRQCVCLVHGFLAHTILLVPLGIRLRRHGFRTNRWGYWNMQCSILVHAQRLSKTLVAMDTDPEIDTIHFVTHSMGSIIARAAITQFRPRKLGRFVMLAPPNRGSFLAAAVAGLIGGIVKPVAELSTAPNSLVNSLPMPLDVEIGILAAGKDNIVSLESTRPRAPHSHVTLPCRHSSLLFRRDAAELVAAFLTHGEFPHRQKTTAHNGLT